MKPRKKRIFSMQWVVLSIVLLGMCSTASAGSVQLGAGLGVYVPTSDAEDVFKASPGFHGSGLVGLRNSAIKIETELGVWLLQDNLDRNDFSGTILPLTGGFRYYLSTLHLDGGIGAYPLTYSWESAAGNTHDESTTDFGVYGGVGLEIQGFDLKFRTHWLDFEDAYVGFSIGYLFTIAQFADFPTLPEREY